MLLCTLKQFVVDLLFFFDRFTQNTLFECLNSLSKDLHFQTELFSLYFKKNTGVT